MMSFNVHCPVCREKKRVPDNAVGGRVQCFRCETIFTVARETSLLEAPAVMDGAVTGALAGTAAGVVVGAIAGAIDGGRTHEAAVSHAILGALGHAFLGLIVGFSLGVISGCLIGILIRFKLHALETRPWHSALIIGGILGAVVALVIRDFFWVPLGAVLGAGAASIWPLFRRRLGEMVPAPFTLSDSAAAGSESEAEVHGES
jgi:hypothetical protein